MLANIINFLTESAISSAWLFIPLFAQELKASQFEIGLIGAIYGLAMFLSFYLFGRLADIYGRRKILLLGLLVSALSFPLQIFPSSPLQLFLVRGLVGFCLGIFPAALVSYIYEVNKKVGKFTSFGSLGWAIAYFLAGVLAVYWKIFLLGSLFLFLAFLLALKMEIPTVSFKIPLFPIKIIKNNFPVYFSYLLRHSAAYMIWIIFPLYLTFLGLSKFQIGVIYFTNPFFQFLLMPKIDRFKGQKLVLTGLFLSGLTFFSFTLAKNFLQFLPTHIFLAVSWSCLYVGSMKSVLENNTEKSTSAGLLKSTISLSGIFGSLFGGLVSQYFGYLSTIYIAVVITFSAFLFFYFTEFKKYEKNF